MDIERSRREELLRRLMAYSLDCLGTGSTYSSPFLPSRINGNTWGRYFFLLSRNGDNKLFLKEMISLDCGDQWVYRSWSFIKDSGWDLVRIERAGRSLRLEEVKRELEDLHKNLDRLKESSGKEGFYFDSELLTQEQPPLDISIKQESEEGKKRLPLGKVPLLAAAGIVLISLTFVAVNNGRYKKLKTATEEINYLLSEYNAATAARFQNIDGFITETIRELELLTKESRNDLALFEFNRRSAYINVIRLAEELTKNLPARKEAYKLIAENIMESQSYGEIIYEISRLPSEEYQARILLATDRQKVETLSRLKPVFSNLLHPVKLETEANDGRGFRITSGYMDKRADPLGSGGVKPHYAVDIINVSNIAFINYAGEIIRQGNPPGNVVAVASGNISDSGFDPGYGWFIEIDHGLNREVSARYPQGSSYRSFYGHLVSEPAFAIGAAVEQNQVLGEIGESGISTGPHLHYEIRIYNPTGAYRSKDGRFDKINPYPGSTSFRDRDY